MNMDFQTKKFWVFVGLATICVAGMVMGKLEFMEGLVWISGMAGTWGLLDTAAKFAKPKGG